MGGGVRESGKFRYENVVDKAVTQPEVSVFWPE